MADRVIAAGDAQGLPFVIVDKRQARVLAFDASGRLVGTAPALLGLALGDRSAPEIGHMRLADIAPAQRITPAGRFEAQLGANLAGDRILWIDYDAALSLHIELLFSPAGGIVYILPESGAFGDLLAARD